MYTTYITTSSPINSQSHISLVFMYEYSVAADNFFCHQSDFLQRLLDNKVPEIKRETPAQFSKTGTVIAIIPFLIHTSVFIPTILQNMGWVFSQFSFQFASRHKAIAAKSWLFIIHFVSCHIGFIYKICKFENCRITTINILQFRFRFAWFEVVGTIVQEHLKMWKVLISEGKMKSNEIEKWKWKVMILGGAGGETGNQLAWHDWKRYRLIH